MDSSKLNNQLGELNVLVGLISHDITSLSAGTKSSSTHARKRLSTLSKLCTAMRAECMTCQKSIPTKTRKKKVVDTADAVEELTQDVQAATLDSESDTPAAPVLPKKKGRGRPKKVAK